MAYNFPRDNDAYPLYMADGTVINSYDQGVAYNTAQEGGAPTNNILGPNDETGYGSISDAAAQNGGFANRQAYIEYLYPGGTWLDSQRYQLPEGMTRDSGPVNPPVANWNPADSLDFQLMPWLIAGGAGLGLMSGAGAAGGAAEAGGAAAGAAYDPALMEAAYSGMGATGAGTQAAALGAEPLLSAASGLPTTGAATGGFTAAQLAAAGVPAAASGLGGLSGPTATPGTGTATTAAGAVAPGVLSKIMDGTATADDWGKLLGSVAPGVLGYMGASDQSNTLKSIYDQQRADRAPALAAYNNALANPNEFYNSAPAMGSVDAVLRKLSMQGNPAGNPGLMSQAAAYNLGGYNNYLSGLAGPAFGGQATQAQLGTNIAQAGGGQMDAIGLGLGRLLNPQPSLADTMKQYGLTIGGMRV